MSRKDTNSKDSSSISKTAGCTAPLILSGATEHNLKCIDLEINHNEFIAITGLSGSGKSSLAFDTIYAEGARRYIETFSPYTRQFLDRLKRPEVHSIENIRPTLALKQNKTTATSRSTVGTATEINDYLKLIWANLSELKCPNCKENVKNYNSDSVAKEFLKELKKRTVCSHIFPCFRLQLESASQFQALSETMQLAGFSRWLDVEDFSIHKFEHSKESEDRKAILVLVDRIKLSKDTDKEKLRKRLTSSIEQCFEFGRGEIELVLDTEESNTHKKWEIKKYSRGLVCDFCTKKFPSARPSTFSFNSPLGACTTCNGFGNILVLNIDACVPDTSLSIAEGAIECWSTEARKGEQRKLLSFCEKNNIPTDMPWSKLSKKNLSLLLEGKESKLSFLGLKPWFKKLEKKTYKMHIRVFLSRRRKESTCADCLGSRLKPMALDYLVEGKNIFQIFQTPISDLIPFFQTLHKSRKDSAFSKTVIAEVVARLEYLAQVGLNYLSLDRQMKTLSGGECQRVNLTALLGSRLTNTIVVLDEPTVGLHSSDTRLLIDVISGIKERGNSVLVVEHDGDVISSADTVIDIGPSSGSKGGEVLIKGTPKEICEYKDSLTGKYLKNPLEEFSPSTTGLKSNKKLEIIGASARNLKEIDVSIALNCLVVLSGISGSGKSTLVEKCLKQPLDLLARGRSMSDIRKDSSVCIKNILGNEEISEIIFVDQSPIGKSPRANPATYLGAWDSIRQILSETPLAQSLGLSKSAFSFNVDGGRCPECTGAGSKRVQMQFLSDVFVDCEQCAGERFQERILDVRYRGHNVGDILKMPIQDAAALFGEEDNETLKQAVRSSLSPLLSLGLGYLRLGQPLSNLSGGEAQRVKLASYLGSRSKGNLLFVLDEPTTGLHPHNVKQLLEGLRHLISAGHSVLVVEHNKEIILSSDWLIDLGPGSGDFGGQIVVQGETSKLLKSKAARKKSRTLDNLFEKPKLKTTAKKQKTRTNTGSNIEILGARQNNLKNISLSIPKNKIVCITGVSGSGKSSLAFEILFSEGQRRYIDCLSPYARQFIKQLEKPDVELIDSLPPTVALSQKTSTSSALATVGTLCEVYQFLRLLFSKAGEQHCPKDNTPLSCANIESLRKAIQKCFKGKRIFIYAPIVSGRKGHYGALFERALKADIDRARIDGKVISISSELRLERHKVHWISLLVGSLQCSEKNTSLLDSALEQALLLSGEEVEIAAQKEGAEVEIFSMSRCCPKCQTGYRELDPQDFSFSSQRGACTRCSGLGKTTKGICSSCQGARIKALGRHVYFAKKTIHQLAQMNAKELLSFFSTAGYSSHLAPVVRPILREITHRLQAIVDIGLDYIALERHANSVSGGEAQRLRLAKTLGSPLIGVCYIFDEPTIGLHPSDHSRLMETLRSIRDAGNSVIVVEHDEDMIRAADHVIDFGPGGGSKGGFVVAEGKPKEIEDSQMSETGRALKLRKVRAKKRQKEKKKISTPAEYFSLKACRANNLRSINVKIQKNALNVVCGVSGAGKSSLVHLCLSEACRENLEKKKTPPKKKYWDSLSGFSDFRRLVEIDQNPLGRTPSSTPASYLGIFDEIRKIFANSKEAKARGWTASHFSFNSGKGRCEECSGKGYQRIPMSFLPDAISTCAHCEGNRYKESVSEILYKGFSIADILKKTVLETKVIFSAHGKIARTLAFVESLGLGYITLGQPTFSLSGGEAQRLKIAKELGLREAVDTLYILDEPTVGLHMSDVDKLIFTLHNLIARANTVLVIEHNTDIIRAANNIIEIGPEAGDKGGKLLFNGSYEELMRSSVQSPTKEALI